MTAAVALVLVAVVAAASCWRRVVASAVGGHTYKCKQVLAWRASALASQVPLDVRCADDLGALGHWMSDTESAVCLECCKFFDDFLVPPPPPFSSPLPHTLDKRA